MFQKPLEKKLSALLGAEVTFERLKVSLLGGWVEASGVRVEGADADRPLLVIRRVRAEISVARALAKQFVIRSLRIEEPVVHLTRQADGTVDLFPKSTASGSAPPLATASSAPFPVPQDAAAVSDESSAWKMEAQKIEIVSGAVFYRDVADAAPGYQAALEGISLDFQHQIGNMQCHAQAEGLSRLDRRVSLGSLRAEAAGSGIADLTEITRAAIDGKVELAGGLKLEFTSVTLAEKKIAIKISGPVDLAEIIAFAPPSLLPAGLPVVSGQCHVSIAATFDPAMGLRISAGEIRMADISLR